MTVTTLVRPQDHNETTDRPATALSEPRGRQVAILKPVSSALSIGTGGPFGAEGPIIQTGSAIGSLLGQMLHSTTTERSTSPDSTKASHPRKRSRY